MSYGIQWKTGQKQLDDDFVEQAQIQPEMPFEVTLHGAETRDKWKSFAAVKGWTESKLNSGFNSRAIERLLHISRELYFDNNKNLDKKLIINLENAFLGKNIDGYIIGPSLAALERDTRTKIYENSTDIAIAGYLREITNDDNDNDNVITIKGKQYSLVGSLSFQDYSTFLRIEFNKIFGIEGPYYPLMQKVIEVLNTQCVTIEKNGNKLYSQVKEIFNFNNLNEILNIKTEPLISSKAIKSKDKEEFQEYFNMDSDKKDYITMLLESGSETNKDAIRLNNNPYRALEILLTHAANTADLDRKSFYLSIALSLIQCGIYSIVYKTKSEKRKDRDKEWLVVELLESRKYDCYNKLIFAIKEINKILMKIDSSDTIERLLKVERRLSEILSFSSNRIIAIILHVLKIKPINEGGGLFEQFNKLTTDDS